MRPFNLGNFSEKKSLETTVLRWLVLTWFYSCRYLQLVCKQIRAIYVLFFTLYSMNFDMYTRSVRTEIDTYYLPVKFSIEPINKPKFRAQVPTASVAKCVWHFLLCRYARCIGLSGSILVQDTKKNVAGFYRVHLSSWGKWVVWFDVSNELMTSGIITRLEIF